MVKELLKACPFLKAQSTQPKKPQRGGPVNIFRTEEPQGPSPLRGATVRTVHCFHSTAQPQESVTGLGQVSSCGCGGRVGGGSRPVTTAKDGSLRAQAVNPTKSGGTSRERIPKESETLSRRLATKPRSQSLHRKRQVLRKSSRPGLSSETGQVKASGTQSTWPVQCGRTK